MRRQVMPGPTRERVRRQRMPGQTRERMRTQRMPGQHARGCRYQHARGYRYQYARGCWNSTQGDAGLAGTTTEIKCISMSLDSPRIVTYHKRILYKNVVVFHRHPQFFPQRIKTGSEGMRNSHPHKSSVKHTRRPQC